MTNRGIIAIGAVIILTALASGVVFVRRQHAAPPVLITDAPIAIPTQKTPVMLTPAPLPGSLGSAATVPQANIPASGQQTRVYVHVAGSVKHPGLYSLPVGSRVGTAIDTAGGLNRAADADAVNLAEPVIDGEKVYVPRKSEQIHVADAGNTIGYVPALPKPAPRVPANSAFVLPKPVPRMSANNTFSSPEPAPLVPANSAFTLPNPAPTTLPADMAPKSERASHSNKLKDPTVESLNLNTATVEDLERLPDIGPAMAGRIIAFRDSIGAFHSIDDLREVHGIGEKKLAKIAPFIRL